MHTPHGIAVPTMGGEVHGGGMLGRCWHYNEALVVVERCVQWDLHIYNNHLIGSHLPKAASLPWPK